MKLTLFDLDYDRRQGNITSWPAQKQTSPASLATNNGSYKKKNPNKNHCAAQFSGISHPIGLNHEKTLPN